MSDFSLTENKALVYIIREKAFTGSGAHRVNYIDGKKAGVLGNGDGYQAVVLSPGKHSIAFGDPRSPGQQNQRQSFHVSGGQKYSLKYYQSASFAIKVNLSKFKKSDLEGRVFAGFSELSSEDEPAQAVAHKQKSQPAPVSQENDKDLAERVNELVASGEKAELISFLNQHPDMVGYIKDPNYRLLLTGPEKLRVGKIVKMLEKGFGKEIVIAKIKGADSPYKDFSMQELELLKELGLGNSVIAAMMEVTNRLKRDQEERARQEAYLAEQRNLMRQSGTEGGGRASGGSNSFAGEMGKEVGKQVGKEMGKKALDYLF
jgi:hypothetical protein